MTGLFGKELEDYFPEIERDTEVAQEMQKVLEGRDIKSQLKKLYPDVIFQLLGPRKGTDGENSFYTLQMIVVKFGDRQTGLGSSFMTELVRLVKLEQTDIAITPDASYQEPISKGGMSKGQLTQWYKKFGFEKKHQNDNRFDNTYCFYAV